MESKKDYLKGISKQLIFYLVYCNKICSFGFFNVAVWVGFASSASAKSIFSSLEKILICFGADPSSTEQITIEKIETGWWKGIKSKSCSSVSLLICEFATANLGPLTIFGSISGLAQFKQDTCW